MKRFITFLVFSVMCNTLANAQLFHISKWDYHWDVKSHEKGQLHFSYGYGQPKLDRKLFDYQKDSANYKVVGIGPFFFKTEYGLSRKLSVMLSAAYVLYESNWTRLRPHTIYGYQVPFTYGTHLHDISANLRFNYHMFVNKDWDVYVGGGMGYNHFMAKDFTTYGPDDTLFKSHFKLPYPVSYEMSFGVRYYFLTRTAIYLEAGVGKALVQGGFVYKFRHRKRG